MIQSVLATIGVISVIKTVKKYGFIVKIIYNGYKNSREYQNEKSLVRSMRKWLKRKYFF